MSGDAIAPRYRRVPCVALAITMLMFAVAIVGGVAAETSALQLEALDGRGDAAGAFTARQGWHDSIVAVIMGVLSLSGAPQIPGFAQYERRDAEAVVRSARWARA
jgi:hypothetical protein